MRCFRMAVPFVLLTILFSVLGAVSEGERPFLVKISRSDPSAVTVLRERGIPVHFKLQKWYIASAEKADLERFEAVGMVYDVLDEEAWTQPYYVMNRPGRQELGSLPDVGTVLFQDNMKALVKIGSDEALELARSGFQFTKIFQKALPLFDPETEEAPRIRARRQTENVIGAIVNQVSQATIQSYVQSLQDFQTRLWASEPIWPASQWIYDKFIEFGYTDVVFEEFIVSGEDYVWYQPGYDVAVRNVIATKPGVLYPDIVYIIGGHYDSIVIDGVTDPYVWAPGANDNATGTVGAMEAARILADVDLDCTVKFAAWTAEEIGLYGAEYYAENAHQRGENIALYINYDMIANLDESDPVRDINIGRSSGAEAYSDLMVQMINQYTTLVPDPYITGSGGSDHGPFMQYGYDILYASEGDFSPHWHEPTDVVDNMDIPYFCEVVKMGLATLATLAGPPESFPEPLIAFEDYEMDDDDEGGSTGNENGYFDAGETVQVSLALHNYGDAQANNVSGRLYTDDPLVTVLDDEVSFGNIPSGGSVMSQGQFRFAISEECPNGRYLNFSLDASASDGYEWTTYFTARVAQPDFVYHTFDFEETVGDGDGVLDPGETISLKLFIGNTGLRGGSGITAELETDDADVSITDNEAVFPDLALGATVENSDPFKFSISQDAAFHAILFTVRLSEGEGYYETELNFRLLIGQGPVLLVPDDGGTGNEGYYIEAFQSLGVPYEVAEVQGVAKTVSSGLLDYSEVIWFTGAAESNTLTPDDQSDLETFLNGGGRLLLSGSMIGYETGNTSFYREYLHGDYVSFITMLHHLNGVPSNPVVGGYTITLTAEGSNAQGFAGETDPISPAVSIFNYDRSTEEGPGLIRSSGSGALTVETSVYKVVYFSFGVEGIEPLEDRVQVLADVLSWFKEPGVNKGDVDGNGTTDIIDAVVAVNIVLGMLQPDEGQRARADMNYDGAIDILDVVKVVNAVLGSSGKVAGGVSTDM
ncbi:MAG: M20/M25/M40 family metallo-hydrolase [Gemmatimonadota bacterium]|nr:MAG: M20/M25/M40 family metallo-hydrolase [Gemmatimonadota bacterium]